MKIDYWKLIGSIALCHLAGIIGGLANSSSTWYAEIIKPSFQPPGWVFGPVWLTLYTLMGVSLYLVWVQKADKKAYYAFGAQLFLNALWSISFFGLESPLLALIIILVLLYGIVLTILYFYKTSKLAAYLLIPYLLWVSFATVLNFSIFYLN